MVGTAHVAAAGVSGAAGVGLVANKAARPAPPEEKKFSAAVAQAVKAAHLVETKAAGEAKPAVGARLPVMAEAAAAEADGKVAHKRKAEAAAPDSAPVQAVAIEISVVGTQVVGTPVKAPMADDAAAVSGPDAAATGEASSAPREALAAPPLAAAAEPVTSAPAMVGPAEASEAVAAPVSVATGATALAAIPAPSAAANPVGKPARASEVTVSSEPAQPASFTAIGQPNGLLAPVVLVAPVRQAGRGVAAPVVAAAMPGARTSARAEPVAPRGLAGAVTGSVGVVGETSRAGAGWGLANVAGNVPAPVAGVTGPPAVQVAAAANSPVALAAPAGLVAGGVTGDAGKLAAGLAAAVTAMTREGKNMLSFRLDPPALGNLSIHLAVGDDAKVNVLLVAAVPQTVQAFTAGADDLRQALVHSGIDLGQLNIGGGKADSGFSSGAKREQPQPQPARPTGALTGEAAPNAIAAVGVRAIA